MKNVTWPAPQTINGELLTPLVIAQRLVLSREHVRDKSKVIIALDVETKLEGNPATSKLTDEEWELLTTGLRLQGEALVPPNFNRYVLTIIRALYVAETVAETVTPETK